MYGSLARNSYQFIDIPLSASILIHELGHHQGVKDHSRLDKLGTVMQSFLLTHTLRAEFWNGNAALITLQNNIVRSDEDKNHLHYFDQVLLENDSRLYDLKQKILTNIQCPNKKEKPIGLRLYNVHEDRGVTFNSITRKLVKPVIVWYILSCKMDVESDHGDLNIELPFIKNLDDSFTYLPEQMTVKQKSCAYFSKSCK